MTDIIDMKIRAMVRVVNLVERGIVYYGKGEYEKVDDMLTDAVMLIMDIRDDMERGND